MSEQVINWKPIPDNPQIFHITHLDNLPAIIAPGGLLSDWHLSQREESYTNIGHSHIKERRMNKTVPCFPNTTVGQYVPFYFCPRSAMLLAINDGLTGHPKGSQKHVIHLVSSVKRATRACRRWAFTTTNAATAFTRNFYTDTAVLNLVNWSVMPLVWWSQVKDERAAEFLVFERFPWTSVSSIGVMNKAARERTSAILAGTPDPPPIHVRPDWYYV